jgi:hypothetical protein
MTELMRLIALQALTVAVAVGAMTGMAVNDGG